MKGKGLKYPSQKLLDRPSWIATTTNIKNRNIESANVANATPVEQHASAANFFNRWT